MQFPVFAQNTPFGAGHRPVLITGPHDLSTPQHAQGVAHTIAAACGDTHTPWVFAANTEALHDASGPAGRLGLHPTLTILSTVGDTFEVPTLVWVHTAEHIRWAANTVDILALSPRVLKRPELLELAAQSGRVLLLGDTGDATTQAAASQALREQGNAQLLGLVGATSHPDTAHPQVRALDTHTLGAAIPRADGVYHTLPDSADHPQHLRDLCRALQPG